MGGLYLLRLPVQGVAGRVCDMGLERSLSFGRLEQDLDPVDGQWGQQWAESLATGRKRLWRLQRT